MPETALENVHQTYPSIYMPVFRILIILHLLTGCAVSGDEPELLADFPPPVQEFKQHIDEVRDYLVRTRMRSRTEQDVEWSLPFQRNANPSVEYKGRYLLIHGLNDSPGVWHSLAESLSENGYDVRAILLPGHGNTPEAQLKVSYRQWLQAARKHLEFWYDDNTPFYIGGFSLGSVIATVLALENEGIDGLFLISPAYYSSRNHLLRWASLVSHFKPWVFGGMIREDNPVRYNSIPINATAQYYKTTRYLLRKWRRKKIDTPVLMVATVEDSVVDIDKTRYLFETRFSSDKKQLLLFTSKNTPVTNNELAIPSAHPSRRILNQSHQSLMIDAQHPLFGEQGAVLVCNGNEWEVFSACLFYRGNNRWYAAQGTPSPDGIPVARVTYNPDYDLLMQHHDLIMH